MVSRTLGPAQAIPAGRGHTGGAWLATYVDRRVPAAPARPAAMARTDTARPH